MRKIEINLHHGRVEGLYVKATQTRAPLVVITNGHNGFYRYGMFPYIQEALMANGISSFSYNFSHGGVEGDSDYFTELDKYEKNCMRLETHDLIGVIDGVSSSGIDRDETTQIYLLSHSLGSVPTIFAARNLSDQTIAGLILLAPIKTLKVFPDEMLKKWEENGVYFMRNNRTGQDLPQGSEFLSEIMRHDAEWNIEPAVRDVKSRFLLVHGEEDKDVLPEHSKAIYGWVRDSGNKVELYIIPNAGHTFNTKHPFEGSSPELNKTLHHIVEWIGNEP